MAHFIIMAKSFNINEAGDECLEDATVLAVKPTLESAMKKIDEIGESYTTDEFFVEDSETVEEDYGIVITSSKEDPSFKICIYVEVIEDDDED